MKNVKRYMLDIETLGTYGPAVLLQIAAVNFEGDREVFDVKLNPDNQPKSITTQATIDWWAKKGNMPEGTTHLQDGMNELRTYLKPADEVWSHNFDFDILTNVCHTYGYKSPYHYKKFRDIRTLVALSGIDTKKFDWSKKTHDAVDDCRFQVEYCIAAMRVLESICPKCKRKMSYSYAPTSGLICTNECGYSIDDNDTEWNICSRSISRKDWERYQKTIK